MFTPEGTQNEPMEEGNETKHNMCLMISVYFLVDKLRRLIAYDRQSFVNLTDDWRTLVTKASLLAQAI